VPEVAVPAELPTTMPVPQAQTPGPAVEAGTLPAEVREKSTSANEQADSSTNEVQK